MKKCLGCKLVYYCDTDCQRAHWNVHKLTCAHQQRFLVYSDRCDLFGEVEQAVGVDARDGPAALYADRCEDYAENPPEDLIFRAQSK